MVRGRTHVALVTALLLFGLPGRVGASDPSPLAALLRDPNLRGARVGALVVDLGTGEVLEEHDAQRALVPASTAKLVTAAAALAEWGPAFRFETPVRASTALDSEGLLRGDLWIVGRGDPALVSEELWRLAEELRLLGLREVRGGIGVESTYFDSAQWNPDRGRGDGRAYDAPVSALAANYSSFRIDVRPGSAVGEPLRISIAPDLPYFRLRGRGRTLALAGGLEIRVAPRPDGSGDAVSVRGSLRPADEAKTYWRAVSRPALYAGVLLRAQLEAQGIRVGGGVRVGRAPERGPELLRFRGENLGRIVWKMNKYSNNFIAGGLTKSLGAARFGPPGSWSKGTRALAEYLERMVGTGPEERLVDGSGLSPRNGLSARVLVRVLREAATNFEWGPEFLASLPLGGLDGTLEDRVPLSGVFLRAKTGHIRGVSALCGVVPRADGRRIGFAILVNGARASRAVVDGALDAFVGRLAGAETLAPGRTRR